MIFSKKFYFYLLHTVVGQHSYSNRAINKSIRFKGNKIVTMKYALKANVQICIQ